MRSGGRSSWKLRMKNRVKREVFELNNKYRIENGEDPLPLPLELQPNPDMNMSNVLQIHDDRSVHPSMYENQNFGPGVRSIPPSPLHPRNQNPDYQYFRPNMSPDRSMIDQNGQFLSENAQYFSPQKAFQQHHAQESSHMGLQSPPHLPVFANYAQTAPVEPPSMYQTSLYNPPQPPTISNFNPNSNENYGELQELRDKQKALIQSYVDEISNLKSQKQNIMQEMVESKKKQMEDDHKIFQDKLNELKSSLVLSDPQQKQTSPIVPGNSANDAILQELDRMRERLQQARSRSGIQSYSKSVPKRPEHPSDVTRTNIVIDNPMAESKHYVTASTEQLEKSLPGYTKPVDATKTVKIQKNEPKRAAKAGPSPSPILDKDHHERTIGKEVLRNELKKTEELKNVDDEADLDRDNGPEETVVQTVMVNQIMEGDVDIDPKQREAYKQVNELKSQPQVQQDRVEEIRGRSGSPVIPALRKKLSMGYSEGGPAFHETVERTNIPRRSTTEIGQEYEPNKHEHHTHDLSNLDHQSVSKHIRNPSVTNLGTELEPAVDESRDIGKPPLSHQKSYMPTNHNKLMDSVEAEFKNSKHRKFTDLISLKDNNAVEKSGPVTARKDYLSDEDADKKNSFRRYILQNPTYPDSPQKERDLDQTEGSEDISLMQGLPASMKKLRELSMDRSRSNVPINENDYFKDPNDDSGEIDMNLKFFNKSLLKSYGSMKNLRHHKSSSQAVVRKKSSKSRFRPRNVSRTPAARKSPLNKKNVSFEMSPRENTQKPVFETRPPRNNIKYKQPADYLEDEVNSQYLRESFSQMAPPDRKGLYPETDLEDEEHRVKPIESASLRRRQEELENDRRELEQAEIHRQQPTFATVTNNDDFEQYYQNRSRSESYRQSFDQPQPKLPPVDNRRNSNSKNMEKDIAELKRQLSALSKRQREYFNNEQKITEPHIVELPAIRQKSIEYSPKQHLPKAYKTQMTNATMLSQAAVTIGNSPRSKKSLTILKRPKKQQSTALVIDLPVEPKASIVQQKPVRQMPTAYEDPFTIHEKLKRNMMLYIHCDPSQIDHSNLNQRLDAELKTIKPTVMKKDSFSSRDYVPIPIETKQRLVQETDDMLNYYQYTNIDAFDDSLDNLTMYIKSLKNKFIEDLIFRKIQMISEQERKQKLDMMDQFKIAKSEESQELSYISNQVFAQDSHYEELKEIEKEVDKTIEKEHSFDVFKDDTLGHVEQRYTPELLDRVETPKKSEKESLKSVSLKPTSVKESIKSSKEDK